MKYASLAALAVLSTPAYAATVVTTGDTTGQPTYNRPVTTTSLSAVGTAVPYQATTFTVDTAGSYSLALNSDEFDTFLSLYSGSFDPTNALANLLAVDDDSGEDLNSVIDFALSSGTSYIAVVSGFANNDFGSYTITFNGPGNISVDGAGAVPEPATWALLLLGFGVMGSAVRSARRRPNTVTYA